jgi:hypothetical protein
MGKILNAECSCGFRSELGGVGVGFAGVYYAPAICFECSSLRYEPYRTNEAESSRRVDCPECGWPLNFLNESGYYRPDAIEKEFGVSFPWDVCDSIEPEDNQRVYYRCPKCWKLEMELLFRGGSWD